MNIAEYLDEVRAKYASGEATEHSYRPALQRLFESIEPTLTVINEPKQSEGGMPDFLFQRGDVPLGWCEAKDVDKDVIKLKGYSKEQRKRYEAAYPNLIYTNGVDFEFIREGEQVHFVSIADFLMGLQPTPERFDELERQLRLFAEQKPISIRSAAKLAKIMAAKAAIMKDEIGLALKEDKELRTGLGIQFKSFKANLLPALKPDEFADLYAETITYGMFAARFHDQELGTFSRQEAMEDLPASNPFLKGLFGYIAGPGLPKRLEYIVDDLVHVMRASNPHALFEQYGKFTARNDPFIHFYEDFLKEYNPAKRKNRGVYYTPEPVVNFIVQAVDDVLKNEFGLANGLADTSKVTVNWDTGSNDNKGKAIFEKREVHRVQILDPATGTGTFLAAVVRVIAAQVKARAPGKWSGYVEQDLLPRLHGFELLMASYAMCHMKLDMMLDQTGYKPSAKPPRLSVWLTNALEPADRHQVDLFMPELVEEARGASEVKRQSPIMCVIGNPPYSGESANKGDHIMKLMEAYKKEPGAKEKLKERNSKWINDDYVKFIRMSEELISKNPSGGVLGFITNHGYLDNPTFRGMRWHLLKTFDKIWVLDLHGNSKKKEVCPDGSPDKNVFDIMQGVAIIIAMRKGPSTDELAEVWHGDLWGTRKAKNETLWENGRVSLADKPVTLSAPSFAFEERDQGKLVAYENGFSVSSLMPTNSVGIVTARDALTIDVDRARIWHRVQDMRLSDVEDLRVRYALGKDVRDWRVDWAQKDILDHFGQAYLREIAYRPFDNRWTYYTGRSRGFMCYPRDDVMRHMAHKNVSLMTPRQAVQGDAGYSHVIAIQDIVDNRFVFSNKGIAQQFPLYLYPDEQSLDQSVRLNLEPKLFAAICRAAGIDPEDTAIERSGDKHFDFRSAAGKNRQSELKVFDYIYGVLHSPDYRSKFAEFLKIDFPRIPYPPSPEVFAHVSEKGEALRRLHLMEDAAIGDAPYPFLGEGDDVVASGYPKWEADKVFINPDQHFDAVPKLAWEFHIGGYQPAQKWLKDRRGRTLSYEDVRRYQKIVRILIETDRIMGEIELPLD